MREERKVRFYRPVPSELVLIVVFALFFALVLVLLLIPVLSFVQQQGQTSPVRRETGLSPVAARRREGRLAAPKIPSCSRGVVVPDPGDDGVIHRNFNENQEVLASLRHKFNPVPRGGEPCSSV